MDKHNKEVEKSQNKENEIENEKDVNNILKMKEADIMATMTKPSVYEFNVKEEYYGRVVKRINEERIKADFIKKSFQVASQYKKPDKKK